MQSTLSLVYREAFAWMLGTASLPGHCLSSKGKFSDPNGHTEWKYCHWSPGYVYSNLSVKGHKDPGRQHQLLTQLFQHYSLCLPIVIKTNYVAPRNYD